MNTRTKVNRWLYAFNLYMNELRGFFMLVMFAIVLASGWYITDSVAYNRGYREGTRDGIASGIGMAKIAIDAAVEGSSKKPLPEPSLEF